MAGHSQFKNIMHRKGRQDAQRAKLFAKLAREITVAARMGSADPAMNPRLRLAIQNARGQSMPKDNIERAIGKAQGDASSAANYEEIRYEGYGPGGVAFIVEALSDNRNRTASSVRSAFSRAGGALGESGSVAFLFDRLGEIVYPTSVGTVDCVLEKAIAAGADDLVSDADHYVISSGFLDIAAVSSKLEDELGAAQGTHVVWKPRSTVALNEEEARKVILLIEALEDDDDVQNVYTNLVSNDPEIMALSGDMGG